MQSSKLCGFGSGPGACGNVEIQKFGLGLRMHAFPVAPEVGTPSRVAFLLFSSKKGSLK